MELRDVTRAIKIVKEQLQVMLNCVRNIDGRGTDNLRRTSSLRATVNSTVKLVYFGGFLYSSSSRLTVYCTGFDANSLRTLF